MSNARKKQFKLPKLTPPRSEEEIRKAYAELIGKSGQLQYQILVYKNELKSINESLLSLNHEAAARQKLDTEAKPKEEVSNEPA